MMKLYALTLALTIISAYGHIDPVEEFSTKYKRASTERERMAVCIEVIDKGLISVGASVKTFDAIFGTKLMKQLPAPGEPFEKSGIDFAEQLKIEKDNAQQVPYVGWYFQIEFDHQGTIRSYFLSNMSK
jgi:hypothetical protein